LHVSDENVLLEIVKDNEPVSFGEDGKILLTNLHGYGMPLVRYDIGDIGRMFPDECPCGRHLSLVKPFGRKYEYFVGSDGSFTYLHDIQLIFEGLPVTDFQIVQENYDEIVIKVFPDPGYTREHSSYIEKNIRERGKARIRVELIDSMTAERSGKTRHVVTKLPSEYT
jgi:phenylacetate-CoA ligase